MTISSVARERRADVAGNWRSNLERAMLSRNFRPEDYDLDALSDDLRATIQRSEYETPSSILTQLGHLVPLCVPAYHLTSPSGVRFPAADNLLPHIPTVANGRDLGRRFHAVEWIMATADLGNWYQSMTGKPADFRLEDALFDLLLAFPDIDVNERVARMIAGRVGMGELIEAIESYRPGTDGHWFFDFGVEDQDGEDDTAATIPNMSGGAFGWGERR